MTIPKKNSEFSFAINKAKPALPEVTKQKTSEKEKRRIGRKPDSDEGARTKRVVAYLTESEHEKFVAKHEDKSLSAVARKLILNDILGD